MRDYFAWRQADSKLLFFSSFVLNNLTLKMFLLLRCSTYQQLVQYSFLVSCPRRWSDYNKSPRYIESKLVLPFFILMTHYIFWFREHFRKIKMKFFSLGLGLIIMTWMPDFEKEAFCFVNWFVIYI